MTLAAALNLLLLGLGLYVMGECILHLDRMQKAPLCALARYVLAGLCGLWLCYVGLRGAGRGITLMLALTVALFLWPDTWARLADWRARMTNWLLLWWHLLR